MHSLKSKLRQQLSQDQKIRRTTRFDSTRQIDLINFDNSIEVKKNESPVRVQHEKVSRLEKLYKYRLEKKNREKEKVSQRPIFKVTRAPSFAKVIPLPKTKVPTYNNVKSKTDSNLQLRKKPDNHQKTQFQFKVADNHQFKAPEITLRNTTLPSTSIVTRSMAKKDKSIQEKVTNLECLQQEIKMKNNKFFNSLPKSQVFATTVPDFLVPKDIPTIQSKSRKVREKEAARTKAKAGTSASWKTKSDSSKGEYFSATSLENTTFFSPLTAPQPLLSSTFIQPGKTGIVLETTTIVSAPEDISTNTSKSRVLEKSDTNRDAETGPSKSPQTLLSSTFLEPKKCGNDDAETTTIPIFSAPKDVSIIPKVHEKHIAQKRISHKSPEKDTTLKSESPKIPEKDGPYFERLLDSEIDRLEKRCKCWESIIVEESQNITKEILDEVDSSIGQTRLLIRKKFEQFRTLTRGWTRDKKITSDDLQGFWDMIYMQVINLDKRFGELEIAKTNNWEQKENAVNVPVITIKPVKKINKVKAGPSAGLKAAIAAARKKKLENQETDNNGGVTENENIENIENMSTINLDTKRVRTRRQAYANTKTEKVEETQNSSCNSDSSSVNKSSSFGRNKIRRGTVYNLLYGKSDKSENSVEAPTNITQEFSSHKFMSNLELKTTPKRKSIRRSVQSPGLFMMRASFGAKIAELNSSIEKCSINSENGSGNE